MDTILDANAYIQVLNGRGRNLFQSNQFTELLTYLRRTGSRLVIPELVLNEVIARYRDKLAGVEEEYRKACTRLQQIGM